MLTLYFIGVVGTFALLKSRNDIEDCGVAWIIIWSLSAWPFWEWFFTGCKKIK